jgi:hypothetical protein
MALVVADRIKESTTTTGTGTYSLGGAATGFESFATIGNGNTTYYCCTDGTDFEVGIGTYTLSGTTLARTTILQSSNGDDAVNWTAGTRDIFVTQPAEKAVYLDASGNIEAFNASNLTAINASNISSGTLSEDRLPNGGAGAATYGSTSNGTKIDTITLDAKGRVTAVATGATGDILGVTAGTGLSGGGSSGTVTLNLDFSELTDMTADISGTTEFILQNGTTESRKAASEIKLSAFNNDSGFTSNVGDITGVTAGTGLSGGGSSGAVALNVDLSELTDMTATMVGTDEFIVLDNGADRRKAANEIGLSIFNNDSGFTTTSGTVTSVGGTGTVNGISLSGTVTSSGNLTLGGTLGSITVSQLAGSAVTTSAESFADNDTTLMTSAAINDRIESFGYTTNVGDITGVTAGSGLTGGGTSGTVTLNHEDTSSQSSVNNSGRTYIQDITLDTYGHVTGLTSATETVTDTVPNNATITLTAGNALTGGGNFTTDQSGNETITFNHQDTSTQASVNNSGRTYIQDVTLDTYGHVTGLVSATETVTDTVPNNATITLAAGTNLSGGGNFTTNQSSNETITFNFSGTIPTATSDLTNDSGFITSADGGNAQTLDSLDSTQFLRSDAADTKTSGNLHFSDNVKATFGDPTTPDLEIFHDGGKSIILDNGTGNLQLRASNTVDIKDAANSLISAVFTPSLGVNLRYNSATKFETSSTGATVTGTLVADGLDVNGDLTLTSTDAGATENPTLDLFRNSSTPADNDILGHINFSGENSAGEKIGYAEIESAVSDVSDGSEDSKLNFRGMIGGSQQLYMSQQFGVNYFYRDILLFQRNLIFEGATSNANETTLTVTDPTADRTITLPDASGTVALTSDLPTDLDYGLITGSADSTADYGAIT